MKTGREYPSTRGGAAHSAGLFFAALLVLLLTACAAPPPPRPSAPAPSPSSEPEPTPVEGNIQIVHGQTDIIRQRQELLAGENAVDAQAAGYFMDVFRARVRQDLSNTGISIEFNERSILVTFPDRIGFETGSAQLVHEAQRLMTKLADILREFRATLIIVTGHTDDIGDPAFNQNLSERRARSVAQHLHKAGIGAARLMILGIGAERPLASNSDEQGRARNRRVELELQMLVRGEQTVR